MQNDLKHKIESLQGPILVLGASGFIGNNIFRTLYKYRDDAHGTYSSMRISKHWRMKDFSSLRDMFNLIPGDLLDNSSLLGGRFKYKTVFDCMAYGAYPFQNDINKIYKSNLCFKDFLFYDFEIRELDFKYIHSGTSSEYGKNSAAPKETELLNPVGDYAVSKSIWSRMMAERTNIPCANLRLYSVYGPYEDGSRLIPQVIQCGLKGYRPPFVNPSISRDFVYVDDVVEAFLDAANNLKPEDYGGSFNIGTGVKTTIGRMACDTGIDFGLKQVPTFSMPSRDWDHANDWYANPTKARERLGWQYRTSLTEGIAKTVEWYQSQGEGWEWPTLAPRA